MSRHPCYFCDNESRVICVKCKKDVCKDHAHYERHEDHGEWVCVDCHSKTINWSIIIGIIGVILVIVFIVVGITMYNNFASDSLLP